MHLTPSDNPSTLISASNQHNKFTIHQYSHVMSFGWSAGDISQAIVLIVKVVKALDNVEGASKHYREAVTFLESLKHTLEPLQTFTALNTYPSCGD
jgi:hypothetical protein